jgi:hypothetical protein
VDFLLRDLTTICVRAAHSQVIGTWKYILADARNKERVLGI